MFSMYIPQYGYARFYLFIHQLMDIELFLALPIINNASMNVCIQVYAQTYVYISLGVYT